MHDRPGGPGPAILASTPQAGHMAAFLAPGLQAAFDGCLDEALPADLAALLGQLDRP